MSTDTGAASGLALAPVALPRAGEGAGGVRPGGKRIRVGPQLGARTVRGHGVVAPVVFLVGGWATVLIGLVGTRDTVPFPLVRPHA
jgi:hypothetical protein